MLLLDLGYAGGFEMRIRSAGLFDWDLLVERGKSLANSDVILSGYGSLARQGSIFRPAYLLILVFSGSACHTHGIKFDEFALIAYCKEEVRASFLLLMHPSEPLHCFSRIGKYSQGVSKRVKILVE